MRGKYLEPRSGVKGFQQSPSQPLLHARPLSACQGSNLRGAWREVGGIIEVGIVDPDSVRSSIDGGSIDPGRGGLPALPEVNKRACIGKVLTCPVF